MLTLSQKINKEGDLRKLATLGLGVNDDVISASLYKYPQNINLAAHEVLKKWRGQYEDGTEATAKLRESLQKVNMSSCLQALQWKDRIHISPFLPTASEGWGMVMFSHVSVHPSIHPSVCPHPYPDWLPGGRYASCVHAGGLSCSLNSFKFLDILSVPIVDNSSLKFCHKTAKKIT